MSQRESLFVSSHNKVVSSSVRFSEHARSFCQSLHKLEPRSGFFPPASLLEIAAHRVDNRFPTSMFVLMQHQCGDGRPCDRFNVFVVKTGATFDVEMRNIANAALLKTESDSFQ